MDFLTSDTLIYMPWKIMGASAQLGPRCGLDCLSSDIPPIRPISVLGQEQESHTNFPPFHLLPPPSPSPSFLDYFHPPSFRPPLTSYPNTRALASQTRSRSIECAMYASLSTLFFSAIFASISVFLATRVARRERWRAWIAVLDCWVSSGECLGGLGIHIPC